MGLDLDRNIERVESARILIHAWSVGDNTPFIITHPIEFFAA